MYKNKLTLIIRNVLFSRMTLTEYIKSFPRNERKKIRTYIAEILQISEVYVRSMCSGNKPILGKYAIPIEQITKGAVPRYVTAPNLYPPEEYGSNNHA